MTRISHVESIAPYPGTPSYDMAVAHGFVPPEELEGWTSNFREQCKKLAYVKDKELLEAIRWAGIFRTMYKKKRLYANWVRPIVHVLGAISNVRWNYNLYSLPLEQKSVTLGRKVLKRMMQRKNEELENFC